MSAMASQITSHTIIYPTVYSGADQREYQSSASPSFVRGIHRRPENSPRKGPATRKMFPFDDVIIFVLLLFHSLSYYHHKRLNIPRQHTVKPCAKYCRDRYVKIWVRVTRIFIEFELHLMKWARILITKEILVMIDWLFIFYSSSLTKYKAYKIIK